MDSLATLRDPRARLRHPLRVRHLRPGRSATAGRWRSPTSGCASATPGRSPRPEIGCRRSSFGGHTERYTDERRPLPRALGPGPTWSRACPTTRPILGYRVDTVNTAAAVEGRGASSRSTSRPSTSATTTAPSSRRSPPRTSPRCSTPTTSTAEGKELRLEQQYFFVSCSLQDMLRIHLPARTDRSTSFHEKFAVQLNDTHPAIAVAELMRLLVDEHGMDWDEAWDDHPRDLRLHQPHAAARGAGELAAGAVRARAAAPPGDHLRDQPPLPRRGARALSRRRGAAARACR